MYYLVKAKKKSTYPEAHYSFKDLQGFYEIAEYLDVPIFGKYTVIIKTEDSQAVLDFVKRHESYANFLVYIYTTQAVIDFVSLRKPGVFVKDGKTDYQNFQDLIKKYEILFAKGVDNVLYKSIEHTYEEMDNILLKIKTQYGSREVNEKMLQEFVVVNDIIYPRQVLMAYLNMERWRLQKLRKCIDQMGNDVVYWSIRKSIKKIVKSKVQYLKSGVNHEGAKYINTYNLILMYRSFMTETGYNNDVELLMRLYEKGVTVYDIIQGESDTF